LIQAKLYLQRKIRDGNLELAWSYILDYENSLNLFQDRREAIARWKALCVKNVQASPAILEEAKRLTGLGVKPFDALHVACAVEGACNLFVTTDDMLIKRLVGYDRLAVTNVVDALALLEEPDENGN